MSEKTEWIWWCVKEGVGGDVDRADLCNWGTVSGEGKYNHRDRGCGWRLLSPIPSTMPEPDEVPEWVEIPNPPGWYPVDPESGETSDFGVQVLTVGFAVSSDLPWTVEVKEESPVEDTN